MGRASYTESDHKLAFETWYETRNWTSVAKAINANWSTAKRWASSDYACQWGCQWHNWDALLRERDIALSARAALLDNGVHDPVAHDQAMRRALADPESVGAHAHTGGMDIVRSDLERLKHWEYLWSKVYYSATGLVSDWRDFRGLASATDRVKLEEKLRETFRGGLQGTSLKQCVDMLKTIQQQIDGLQGAARIAQTQDPIVLEDGGQMGIDELRKMREALKNSHPQHLRMLTAEDDATSDSIAS